MMYLIYSIYVWVVLASHRFFQDKGFHSQSLLVLQETLEFLEEAAWLPLTFLFIIIRSHNACYYHNCNIFLFHPIQVNISKINRFQQIPDEENQIVTFRFYNKNRHEWSIMVF